MSHHGMDLADLKYSEVSFDLVRSAATDGIASSTAKNTAIIT
jgi:hypothetical protein